MGLVYISSYQRYNLALIVSVISRALVLTTLCHAYTDLDNLGTLLAFLISPDVAWSSWHLGYACKK